MLRACGRALVFAACMTTYGGTANAITVKFYEDKSSYYSGPYSGVGTVYDVTKDLATDLPSSGVTGSSGGDDFGTAMKFKSDSVTATSSGPANNNEGYRVWNDLSPGYAGLGVDDLNASAGNEDHIQNNEVLSIAFETNQKLLGVGTLFDSSHDPFGATFPTPSDVADEAATIQFAMRVWDNGSIVDDWFAVNFAVANDITLSGLQSLDLVGDMFDFRQCTADVSVCSVLPSPSFYVGAIITEQAGETVVPLPAGIVLLITGLLGLGGLGRFRSKTA